MASGPPKHAAHHRLGQRTGFLGSTEGDPEGTLEPRMKNVCYVVDGGHRVKTKTPKLFTIGVRIGTCPEEEGNQKTCSNFSCHHGKQAKLESSAGLALSKEDPGTSRRCFQHPSSLHPTCSQFSWGRNET